MAGHSPPRDRRGGRAAAAATHGGATLMLPTEDAAWVGEELGAALRRAAVELRADRHRREPLGAAAVPRDDRGGRTCSSSATATTARSTRRSSRSAPARGRGRGRATSAPPSTRRRRPACASSTTSTRSSALLADEQVACVLAEPALTNIGIVLPEPGLPRRAARGVRRAPGTLLIADETHTLSAGPGGCTARLGPAARRRDDRQGDRRRHPDRRLRRERRRWPRASTALEDADLVDVGGVGGTLAGNPLSLAAARATLEQVLTDEAVRRT